MTLPNDNYGRTITMATVGSQDVYTVTDDTDPAGVTVSFPTGTSLGQVYTAINGLAPGDWVPEWQRTDVIMNTVDSTDSTLNVYATSDGTLHVETP